MIKTFSYILLSCHHCRDLLLRYWRLILHCVHKQDSQPNITDAGQCQQRTKEDAKDTRGSASAQIFAAQHDTKHSKQQNHHGEPKRHMPTPYTKRNTSIISVNHVSSRVKRSRSCAGLSRPLPLSKKPRPL